MKKRVVCAVLGLVMMLSQTFTVLAKTEEQLQQEKSQAQSQLSETNAVINSLSEKQTQVQAQINAMDGDMVDLMIQIDATKADITSTEESISQKETDITDKTAEIEESKENLAEAEKVRDKQYQDMKKRIQYIYEHGGSEVWVNMLTGSEDVSSFLNRAEYAQSMHEYDREQLDEYIAVVDQVTELKSTLETQKADLETQKADLETQKASLESQEADLEVQQADLQSQMDAMKATNSDYAAQIEAAQQQASEISNLIAQQDAELQRLAEERRKAEEEAARKAAEEEAARQAAAEEAERQQAAREEEARQEAAREEASREEAAEQQNHTSDRQEAESNSSSNGGDSSEQQNSSSQGNNDSQESSSSKEETSSGSVSSGGSTGEAIVAYADQFVGNPYVWGGNSLTNGIDCSHFVYQVLKNCGVYSGGYTTSAGWRTLGKPVASLSEARAGDVLCYSGHVAIYDGHGGIVEAKGSKWGITHDRRANYKTILAIRRFT